MIEVPVKIALPAPRAVRLTVLLARLCAIAASAIGALVLAGWLFDLSALNEVLPDLHAMAPNAATGVLAAGLGLFCLTVRVLQPIGWLIGFLLAVLGIVSVSQELFGFDLGIDRAVLRICPCLPRLTSGCGPLPWRPAPPDR